MSRPPKIHKPIKGGFNNILASIAHGTGKAKQAANKRTTQTAKAEQTPPPRKTP